MKNRVENYLFKNLFYNNGIKSSAFAGNLTVWNNINKDAFGTVVDNAMPPKISVVTGNIEIKQITPLLPHFSKK